MTADFSLGLGGGNFSGVIEGSTGVTISGVRTNGTGHVIFSGDNTYTGPTHIGADSTLRVGAGGGAPARWARAGCSWRAHWPSTAPTTTR